MNAHLEIDPKDSNYQASQRVNKVGAFWDTILTLSKLTIGILAGSAALVAEGIHSAADLLFDLVVIVGMSIAKRAPDEDHPYGHGKFEGITSLILAVILLGLAAGIVVDGVEKVRQPNLSPPESMALWIAFGSMVVKEILYQYTIRVGRRIKSQILIGNAWHHRADAVGSLAAFIGIGGALMGWPFLDPVAAIAVAFFVGKVGLDIAHGSLKELTDAASAIDTEIREQIAEHVATFPQIKSAHFLKARRMGQDILVDVHVVVDHNLSVSEGHQIADHLQINLFNEVPGISEVLVHVDTEDDQYKAAIPFYPNRHEISEWVKGAMAGADEWRGIREVMPHYVPDGIEMEISLHPHPHITLQAAREAGEKLRQHLLKHHAVIQSVRLDLYLGESLKPS